MTPPLPDVPAGLPRDYLRPCLLLLIAEGTSHGYELLDRVIALGLERIDAGGLYRALRAMDEDGLVRSTWEPSTSGPARRNYELTDDGHQALHAYAAALSRVADTLGAFDRRYRDVSSGQAERIR